jgi:hypothetical protein
MIEDESVVIKQAWFDDIKWFVCPFKLSCWSLFLMQIWCTRRKQSILLIYCTWMSLLYLHFIYYYCSNLAFLTLIILFVKIYNFQIYFFQITKSWKHIFFWNIQECFILDMKIWIFINYSTNMCWSCLRTTLIKSI